MQTKIQTISASSWDDTAAEECTDNQARHPSHIMREKSLANYLWQDFILLKEKSISRHTPTIATPIYLIIT